MKGKREMAYFLNNNFKNNEFELIAKEKYFVDKTDLIDKINKQVNMKERFICITRPRRFGKTINAMMLASYYSKTANFKHLFDKLQIAQSDSYLEHLHKHNVIYITWSDPTIEYKNFSEYMKGFVPRLVSELKEKWHIF